jgi:hypothetical protein
MHTQLLVTRSVSACVHTTTRISPVPVSHQKHAVPAGDLDGHALLDARAVFICIPCSLLALWKKLVDERRRLDEALQRYECIQGNLEEEHHACGNVAPVLAWRNRRHRPLALKMMTLGCPLVRVQLDIIYNFRHQVEIQFCFVNMMMMSALLVHCWLNCHTAKQM